MSTLNAPTVAGVASTVIFTVSTLPMLAKAYRSRDLSSYSLGNIALANVGNAVHSVYVLSLPPGPIWALHGFYLLTSALMLGWYVQYRVRRPPHGTANRMGRSPDASTSTALLASPQNQRGGKDESAAHRNVDRRRGAGRPVHRLPSQAARPPVPHRGRQSADRRQLAAAVGHASPVHAREV